MFWPSMFLFIILAVLPFVIATVLNRRNGDSLSDVDDAALVDPGGTGATGKDEA